MEKRETQNTERVSDFVGFFIAPILGLIALIVVTYVFTGIDFSKDRS